MKTLLLVLGIGGLAVVAGVVWDRHGLAPRVMDSAAVAGQPKSAALAGPKPGSATPATAKPTANPPAAAPAADESSLTIAAAVTKLASGKTSFDEKQRLWREMRAAGSLDDVAAALKDLAARNPSDADLLAALGETLIFQTGDARAHNDLNRVYALGIEADQDFDTALQADGKNWQAQFYKANALAHWPPGMNKGPQSVQMLTDLIAQQQQGAPLPEYAQTYLALGQEYQAMGQSDKAVQIWQDGAAHFPTDNHLLQTLSHAAK